MKSFAEIVKLASKITGSLNDAEYLTATLAKKASDLAVKHPGDSTTKHMAVVLDDISNKNPLITRSQLVSIYNRFHNSNNKFAEAFESELGVPSTEKLLEESSKKVTAKNNNGNLIKAASDVVKPYTHNEKLVEAMQAILTKKEASPFTNTQKKNAIACVSDKLSQLLPESKLSFVAEAGNDNMIVVRACASTVNGQGSAFIPVEILPNNECLDMGLVIGNNGVNKISSRSVSESFSTSIGKDSKYDAKIILAGIMNKFDKRASLSSVDLAMVKDSFANLHPKFASNDQFIVEDKVPTMSELVEKSKLGLDKVLNGIKAQASFSEKMLTKSAQAEVKFGKDIILEAKKAVFNQLRKLGQSVSSINVLDYSNDGIDLSLALSGNAIISTHIKCDNGIKVASDFTYANSKYPMSIDSFKEISNKEASSYERALHSPLLRSDADSIIQEIVRCGREGNYSLAEDGLAVIKEKFQDKYSLACKAYQDSMLPITKVASCNKQLQLKTSMHPLCSHTMLPLKDTYVDADGNCRPNYRRNS